MREALEPILKTIASLSARIRDYDRKLEEHAQEHYPETNLLRQVQGVGVLTALAFVLTLEDADRFEQSRARVAGSTSKRGDPWSKDEPGSDERAENAQKRPVSR